MIKKIKLNNLTKIILISLILRLFFLKLYKTILWDGQVYVSISQAMIGNGGFIEPVRPIILPTILAIFSKLYLNKIIFGRITILIATIISTIIVYKLTEKLMDKKTADYATIIFSFNAIIFFWSFRLYTGILATTFILGAYYLTHKNKYFVAGILGTIGILTRYPAVFIFLPLELYLISKKKVEYFVKFNIGSLIIGTIFLIYNKIMHNNPFKPIALILESSHWSIGNPVLLSAGNDIYVKTLLLFFNFILIFSVINIKENYKNKDIRYLILIPLMFGLTLFQITYMKEERYLIPIIPFLSILCANGLTKIKNIKLEKILLGLYLIISISLIIFMSLMISSSEKIYNKEIVLNNCPTDKQIITSSPESISNYNKLIPFYGEWATPFIFQNMNESECIVYSSCDFTGHFPESIIIEKYNLIYSGNQENCQEKLFKKI